MLTMYVALGVLLVLVVLLVVLLVAQQDRHDAFVLELEERHREERGELMTRIQRPAWAPPPRPRPRAVEGDGEEERPRDESHKVGTVMPLRDLVTAGDGEDDGAA